MLLVLVIISIEHNTNVLDRQVNYDTSENILILTAQVNVNQENRCLHFMSNLWSIVRIRLMGNSKPLGWGGKPAPIVKIQTRQNFEILSFRACGDSFPIQTVDRKQTFGVNT